MKYHKSMDLPSIEGIARQGAPSGGIVWYPKELGDLHYVLAHQGIHDQIIPLKDSWLAAHWEQCCKMYLGDDLPW